MITVEDFIEMLLDSDSQHINIWDNEKSEVIFDGYCNEIPDELLVEDIASIDNVYDDCKGIITLNIR